MSKKKVNRAILGILFIVLIFILSIFFNAARLGTIDDVLLVGDNYYILSNSPRFLKLTKMVIYALATDTFNEERFPNKVRLYKNGKEIFHVLGTGIKIFNSNDKIFLFYLPEDRDETCIISLTIKDDNIVRAC